MLQKSHKQGDLIGKICLCKYSYFN